jgi:peptidoglycan/xylan/chitin deacetylase (PgdA/CDA1 family)
MTNFFLKAFLRIRRMGLILMGHGYATALPDTTIESQHQDINCLKQSIARYQSLGFRFISMNELIELANRGFQSDYPWIHLTFDDGYQNVYSLVYPFLKENRLPFSLFITTDTIDRHEWFYHDRIAGALLLTRKDFHFQGSGETLSAQTDRAERFRFIKRVSECFRRAGKEQALEWIKQIDALLSPEEWQQTRIKYPENEPLTLEQLREMKRDFQIHIGSHNQHHICLNQNVLEGDIKEEMQVSKAWLQDNLQVDALTYCFPKGQREDFTPAAKRICRELGYQLAFTTLEGPVRPGTDRYEMPRAGIRVSQPELEKQVWIHFLPVFLVKSIVFLKQATR